MTAAFHARGMTDRVESAGGACFRAGVIPMSERRAERFSGCMRYTQRLILEIDWFLWQRSDRRLSFIGDPFRRVVVEFSDRCVGRARRSSLTRWPRVSIVKIRTNGSFGIFGSLGRPVDAPGNFHRTFELAPRASRCASSPCDLLPRSITRMARFAP